MADTHVTLHCYAVYVELDPAVQHGVTPEEVRLRLSGAPNWMDGVVSVSAEYLGEIDTAEDTMTRSQYEN